MPLPSLTSLAALLCCSALASSAPTKPSSALGEAASHTPWLDRLGEAEAVGQVRALLGSSEPAGRKLDFLVQEMHREANTIGSKSQHGDIAGLVVALKAEIERMREQVQNVE